MIQVTDVMRHCRNPFAVLRVDGSFTLADGQLQPAVDMREGDLVLIRGSGQNDGLHRLEDGLLSDTLEETWRGTVWLLRPPLDFLRLCRRIREYEAEIQPEKETFGEYSVTRGPHRPWTTAFARELADWRQMLPEVLPEGW